MKILIAGGTGLIGTELSRSLIQQGNEVWVLSRKNKTSPHPKLHYLQWDGRSIDPNAGPFDAIINLAGTGVMDSRWTPKHKAEVRESRMFGTNACKTYIQNQAQKPRVFISSSAVGYYGVKQPGILEENAKPGKDFLAQVCAEWELQAQGAGVRTVILRTGLVMSRYGGAFPRLLKPFKYYAGVYIGSGKQGFPWIHIADVIGIIQLALTDEQLEGPINVCAPEIMDNKGWSRALGNRTGLYSGLGLPAFVIKGMLGESAYILLEGQFVKPAKVLARGYRFQYATVENALNELLIPPGKNLPYPSE